MRRRLLIVLLILTPALCEAGAYGMRSDKLALYWGQSYRINDRFYHTFDISYGHYWSSCTSAGLKGFGLRFDYLQNNNYALGIRYFRSIRNYFSHELIPYWEISPQFFQCNNKPGLNLKPGIGLWFNPFYGSAVGVSLKVSYGYDIPIAGAKQFTAGRHDFSACIALSIRLNGVRSWFRRRTDEKKTDEKKQNE